MNHDEPHAPLPPPLAEACLAATRCPRVASRIRFLANRLKRCWSLSPGDEIDLEQDIWTAICSAFRQYDPAKGTPSAFARGVASWWYRAKLRSIAADRRKRGRDVSFDDMAAGKFAPEEAQVDPAQLAGLRLDDELMKARLPEDLRDFANRLAEASCSEIARQDGVHRGTISRRVGQIRSHIPEFDPAKTD